MALTELQKQREKEYARFIRVLKMRVKETGEVVTIKYF